MKIIKSTLAVLVASAFVLGCGSRDKPADPEPGQVRQVKELLAVIQYIQKGF